MDNSIDGFVKAIGRNEVLPFLGVYQRMVYSYFFLKKLIKKYKLDFIIVTGGSSLIPKSMADKTIVYVHYPVGLEVTHERYLESGNLKKFYIKPWSFISNNLDYIKSATLITNSNYTKQAIKKTWGMDATVIYPPCPQYSFQLTNRKEENGQEIVCSIGRFTPEKDYELILDIAHRRPRIQFELIGNVTGDKYDYLKKLKNNAPKNVIFHVNASIQEKMQILRKSKVMLHAFVGEHFGISLIEAMSAGVIPVTHNSGAAKEDNLVSAKFRFNNIDEAIRRIENALSDWNLSDAQNMREYAKKFSSEVFRKNLKGFIVDWIKLF